MIRDGIARSAASAPPLAPGDYVLALARPKDLALLDRVFLSYFALAAWVASRAPRCTEPAAGGPRIRILLPPADSQSLSRSRFSGSRAPLFRAGLGSWLGDRVSRDAPGSPLRANRRQYLCRPIFQYRSAAEVVSENAAPVPTKLGLLRA